jgi:hypothetical protein
MKKPNFFIIGGQRCGTTSLSRYLSEHSQIFICDPKEPRYFASDLVPGRAGALSLSAYLNLFRLAGAQHLAVGDASPTYLPSTTAVANILAFDPAAKVIVLLRPQIDMARSLHARFYHDGREDVPDFEDAWQLQDARRAHQHIPRFCYEPRELLYGSFCKLGEQLERVYRSVAQAGLPGKNQVLAIFSDELKTGTRAVYERVLDFLAVPRDRREHFPIYEQNRRRRSQVLNRFLLTIDRAKIGLGVGSRGFGIATALDNLNEKKQARTPLRPEFRAHLIDYFRPDVITLSQLTGRDLSHWTSA